MSTEGQEAPGDSAEQVRGWFHARLPGGWFTGQPDILVDREEISVIGHLPGGGEPGTGEDAEAEEDSIVAGRSRRFREETREARVVIAREAERLFGRRVSWGVICEGRKEMFTTLSIPVMTRLRQAERRVLDTLVDAGVARSRSEALAWCVRLVGEHEDAWLAALRDALRRVEKVRASGPRS